MSCFQDTEVDIHAWWHSVFLFFKEKIEVGSFMNLKEHGDFWEPDITFPCQWGREITEILGQHFTHSYSTETASFCRVPWTDANGEFISYAKLAEGNWNGAATKATRPLQCMAELPMELWKWGWINWYAGIFYEAVEACYEFMGGNIDIWVIWGYFFITTLKLKISLRIQNCSQCRY